MTQPHTRIYINQAELHAKRKRARRKDALWFAVFMILLAVIFVTVMQSLVYMP